MREDYEKNKFVKASENIYKIFVKAEGVVALNSPVMMFAVYGCILAISWIGAKMIIGTGSVALTTGKLMSLLNYCMSILMSLMMLSMVFVMLTMSIASAERICEVLNEKPDLKNPDQPVTDVKDGSIEFDHVTKMYKLFKNDKRRLLYTFCKKIKFKEKKAVNDVSFKIKRGEAVALFGKNGAGKTNLLDCIIKALCGQGGGYVFYII